MEGNTNTTAHRQADRVARLVWLFAFAVPLVLAGLLLGVKSAQAASPASDPTAPAPAAGLAFEEDEEELEDEGELAEEECEIAELELELDEITKDEADAICKEAEELTDGKTAGGSTDSEQCPIRSARAHASTRNDRLKLTVGYTMDAPVAAKIQVGGIGAFKRHLGRSGVLRFSKKLGGKRPQKRIKVVIRVPSSAGGRGCGLVQVVPNKVV